MTRNINSLLLLSTGQLTTWHLTSFRASEQEKACHGLFAPRVGSESPSPLPQGQGTLGAGLQAATIGGAAVL